MAKYQRLDFVGYRVFNGGSYKIACSVSLVLNSEQAYRQLQDAAKKMFALDLYDLEWRVQTKNFEYLKDVVKEHIGLEAYQALLGPKPKLMGRPVRLKLESMDTV